MQYIDLGFSDIPIFRYSELGRNDLVPVNHVIFWIHIHSGIHSESGATLRGIVLLCVYRDSTLTMHCRQCGVLKRCGVLAKCRAVAEATAFAND